MLQLPGLPGHRPRPHRRSRHGSAEEVLAAVQALGFLSVDDFVPWGLEADAGALDAAAQTIRSLLDFGM